MGVNGISSIKSPAFWRTFSASLSLFESKILLPSAIAFILILSPLILTPSDISIRACFVAWFMSVLRVASSYPDRSVISPLLSSEVASSEEFSFK